MCVEKRLSLQVMHSSCVEIWRVIMLLKWNCLGFDAADS